MAKPTKPRATVKAEPAAIVQGIFAAGDAAVGLASLREGFGLTPEDDRLFALGWPHLVYLVPGDAGDKELADGKKFSATYTMKSGDTPVGVAPRMLRHIHALSLNDDKKWLAAIRDPSPLSDAEAEVLAGFAITETFGAVVVYLLEALRSPAWVLDRVVAAYEAVVPAWTRTPGLKAFGGGAMRALHFVMLRVTKSDEAAARTRLRAMAKALTGVKGIEFSRAHDALVQVLDPTTGDDLSMRSPADAALIRKQTIAHLATMKSDYTGADARLAFLGGDEVTAAFALHAKRFVVSRRADLVDQFARVAHPKVADLMRAVNNGRAKKWLAAHA